MGGWEEVGGSRGGMRRCETRERVDHGPFLLLARANGPSSDKEGESSGSGNRKKTQMPKTPKFQEPRHIPQSCTIQISGVGQKRKV